MELRLYEAAKAAVAEAKTLADLMNIRSAAEGIAAAAHMAKDRELETNAVATRLLSERRLGQFLLIAKSDGTIKPAQIRLREIGVDPALSMRAQQFAKMDDFDSRLEKWRETTLAESRSRVKRHLSVSVPGLLRTNRRSQALDLSGDLRAWRLGRLRRVVRALAAVADFCGGEGDDNQTLGDLISDKRLEALIRQS